MRKTKETIENSIEFCKTKIYEENELAETARYANKNSTTQKGKTHSLAWHSHHKGEADRYRKHLVNLRSALKSIDGDN